MIRVVRQSEAVAAEPRASRLRLRSLMERHGFRNHPLEWWHYTLIDEPFAEVEFDFPVR